MQYGGGSEPQEGLMSERWIPKYTAGQVEDAFREGIGLVVSTVPTTNPNASGKRTWTLHSVKDLNPVAWADIARVIAADGCVYVHEIEQPQAA